MWIWHLPKKGAAVNRNALFAYLMFQRKCALLLLVPARADNKVMGQVNFVPATKVEKSTGVWVDGQYIGFINELKGDKKLLLLRRPRNHRTSIGIP